MINEILTRLEKRIDTAPSMQDDSKQALLSLVAELRRELAELPSDEQDQVQSIATFAELSAHEATKGATDTGLLDISLQGLNRSVQSFEDSHPRLVQVINAISTMLSNVGI